MPSNEPVTLLLSAAKNGDEAAFDKVVALVYDELYRLAHRVRSGGANETLNTTALVHEAYLHLLPSKEQNWNDRTHFLRVAARAMRQVIVHAAEKRNAQKRGGGMINLSFNEELYSQPVSAEDIVELDKAVDRLAELSPRQAQIVECRFFGGLSLEETAGVLNIGTATVKRDWRAARAWLSNQLRT